MPPAEPVSGTCKEPTYDRSRGPSRGAGNPAGMKPADVSIQMLHQQPPPPSGESTIPQAGTVLIQQSGRSRLHEETVPCSGANIVMLPER